MHAWYVTLHPGGLIGLSFFVLMTLFHLWDLPGDVLAAPESASGLDRCNLSLSLSRALFASSACRPCLLALVLLRVPAWTVSMCILWTSYICSPSGLCATLAAMADARDVISIYLFFDGKRGPMF